MFVSRFTLDLAAFALLPMLEKAGLQTVGAENPPHAVQLLLLLYARVSCVFKLSALTVPSRVKEIESS